MEFIEKEKKKGTSEEEIQHKLLDAGWQIDIIHHALDKIHGERPIAMHNPPTIKKHYTTEQYVIGGAVILVILVLLASFA